MSGHPIPETLNLVERTANPSTRREVLSEIFSNNPANRYDDIPPRPLLFGKKKSEQDILKPKKNHAFDKDDKGNQYHPLMQGAAKHWAATGKGSHTKNS